MVLERLYEGTEAGNGRCWGRRWLNTDRLYEGNGTGDGRKRVVCTKNAERKIDDVLLGDGRFLIVCTKESERRMGGGGSFVRRKRNGGWEVTNRLYSAV